VVHEEIYEQFFLYIFEIYKRYLHYLSYLKCVRVQRKTFIKYIARYYLIVRLITLN
jgi:hypothetical protein